MSVCLQAKANFDIVRGVIGVLETASAAQISGARGRAVEQKSVLDAAMRRKMKRYSRTARALNIDDPGFRRLFPHSRMTRIIYQLILATAREFVEEARRFATDFASLGIPATLADELEADTGAMEAAINAKANSTNGNRRCDRRSRRRNRTRNDRQKRFSIR